jgi:hypothetical protein
MVRLYFKRHIKHTNNGEIGTPISSTSYSTVCDLYLTPKGFLSVFNSMRSILDTKRIFVQQTIESSKKKPSIRRAEKLFHYQSFEII